MRKLFVWLLSLALLALGAVLPVSAQVSYQNSGVTLTLEPAPGSQLSAGSDRSFQLSIQLNNPQKRQIVGAEAFLNFDSNQLEYVSFTKGNVMDLSGKPGTYSASAAAGRVSAVGLVYVDPLSGGTPVTEPGRLITLTFKVKDGVSLPVSASFDFDFTPGVTTDSNVALANSGGQDILQAATGGSYTIIQSTAQTYSISGTISGQGIAGVTVTAGGYSAISNASGGYIISGVPNGSYTVTPSLSGYTYAPASRLVAVSGGNVTGIDFVGSVASANQVLTSVVVQPPSATLYAGFSQPFNAIAYDQNNQAIAGQSFTWTISPSTGSISQSGVYTAPSTITGQQTITVTASATRGGVTKSSTATITLAPTPAPTPALTPMPNTGLPIFFYPLLVPLNAVLAYFARRRIKF